jgi:hypothetical protein
MAKTVIGRDGTKVSEQEWADREKRDSIYQGKKMVDTGPQIRSRTLMSSAARSSLARSSRPREVALLN